MESAVLALQQVIPSAIDRGLNCASVLQEIFTNFRILFLDLTRRRETQTSSTCSNLEIPKVEPSGRPGKPKFEISAEVILELRSYGFTWKQIADMLLASRWTIRRRVVEIWIKLTWAWGQGGKCLFLQWILHCGLTTLLTVVSVVVDAEIWLRWASRHWRLDLERSSCWNVTGNLGLIWNEAWNWEKFFFESSSSDLLSLTQICLALERKSVKSEDVILLTLNLMSLMSWPWEKIGWTWNDFVEREANFVSSFGFP